MCYLITIDPENSETDRKLFGTLAYRMISKAASTVPANPVRSCVIVPYSYMPSDS